MPAATIADRDTPPEIPVIPRRIPECYPLASLRNVTPWDFGQVGVGLETDAGEVIRFRLTASDAAALVRLLLAR